MNPIFTLSPWYFAASYPYGRPIHARRVCYVSAVAKRPIGESALGLELPVSQWTVTVYDDAPRKFAAREARGAWFIARSKRAALRGIRERCDESGKVLDTVRKA